MNITFIVAVCIILFFIGIRKIKNQSAKSSLDKVVHNIDNPGFLNELIGTLSWTVVKSSIVGSEFIDKVEAIPNNSILNNTIISSKRRIDKNTIIIVTYVLDKDLDVTLSTIGGLNYYSMPDSSSSLKEVQNEFQFNYLIKYLPEKLAIEISSELYEDLNAKVLKMDFCRRLVDHLTTS
jgi:hypothetical protein